MTFPAATKDQPGQRETGPLVAFEKGRDDEREDREDDGGVAGPCRPDAPEQRQIGGKGRAPSRSRRGKQASEIGRGRLGDEVAAEEKGKERRPGRAVEHAPCVHGDQR